MFSEKASFFVFQRNELHFCWRGINSFLLILYSARVLPSISLMKKVFFVAFPSCSSSVSARKWKGCRSTKGLCAKYANLYCTYRLQQYSQKDKIVCALFRDMMERRWSLYENFFFSGTKICWDGCDINMKQGKKFCLCVCHWNVKNTPEGVRFFDKHLEHS